MKEKRELMLFIMNEEKSVEDEDRIEESPEEVVELKQLNLTDGTKVEPKTIGGLTNKGTMKLKGDIRGKEVVVLIDSGATHNFLHLKTVEEKKIPLEQGTQFGVTIGNGARCKGRRVCRWLELKLKGLIVMDFLVIELGNVDVVLGIQCSVPLEL